MKTVFEKFGGIRPMAAKLGDVPPSTVKSWHAKGRIPDWRFPQILAAAKAHSLDLKPAELENLTPGQDADPSTILKHGRAA